MKKIYTKYSLVVIIIFLGILLFIQFTPYMSGFLGALTVYILVRKQLFHLTTIKKWNKTLVASLIIGEVILCCVIPLFFVISIVVGKLSSIHIDSQAIISSVQQIGVLVKQKTGFDVLSKETITSIAAYLPRLGSAVVSSAGSFAVNALVLLFVLYFMLIGGRPFEKYVYDLLPFTDQNKRKVLSEIKTMTYSNAVGIPVLAFVQGLAALAGYLIFDTPDPFIFAFITCFATIMPLVGTALIWVPLSAYLALTGEWGSAVGLAAYGVLVISNIDNGVRFILQKKIANTHPLITVFGVVIGLSLFGFWGIVFGPLLLSVFLLCVDIFKNDYLTK